jgi:hypothetical protein
MKNNTILSSLRKHYFLSISMLEEIIEICPDELWNTRKSGYVFWQRLLHVISESHFFLRKENTKYNEPFKDKKVYPELDKESETDLTKEDIKKCFSEAKEFAEIWFAEKDDNWLKLSSKISGYTHLTNYDTMANWLIMHNMYHVGHCDAIFRENGIETGKYLDYNG